MVVTSRKIDISEVVEFRMGMYVAVMRGKYFSEDLYSSITSTIYELVRSIDTSSIEKPTNFVSVFMENEILSPSFVRRKVNIGSL